MSSARHMMRHALIATLLAIGICIAPAYSETTWKSQSELGQELKLPVHMWHDSQREPRGVVLAIPGLVFTGKAYDAIARHMCDQGFVVYSLDLRGYGDWTAQSELDGDSLIHYSQSKEDITNVLSALRRRYPDKPIFCMGESFGANYAIWEASTVPQLIDGVIASGLSYKIVINPRPRWVLTFFQGLAHPRKPMDLKPYLEPILSQDQEATKKRLGDPDTATALSPTDLIKAAITTKWAIKQVANIPTDMPILIMAGAKDQIQKTERLPEVISQMGSKDVQFRVLDGTGHLLLEQPQVDPRVAEYMDSWLQQHSRRRTMCSSKPSE